MLIKKLYQKGLKPLLFKFSPELVHDVFINIGELAGQYSIGRKTIKLLYGSSKLKVITVDGINYHGPVLLAAGFDYNARLTECLQSIGFAGEEVGSVTARACAGNAPPRMTRLINSQSIQVYKGLKNDGVDAIIKRIKTKNIPKDFVLGISIAKTNDEACSTEAGGIEDYFYSLNRLVEENVGHFYTINVSCPNAYGGEDFTQDPASLNRLLSKLKTIKHTKPMYVKMPINLAWEKFEPLLRVIKDNHFQGVVIGNLNKDYASIETSERPQNYRGGLSGKPCLELSNALIEKTRQAYPDNFTIIGCGGIMSKEDALTKLKLGANLVQLISGMIFNGPHLISEINEWHATI